MTTILFYYLLGVAFYFMTCLCIHQSNDDDFSWRNVVINSFTWPYNFVWAIYGVIKDFKQ